MAGATAQRLCTWESAVKPFCRWESGREPKWVSLAAQASMRWEQHRSTVTTISSMTGLGQPFVTAGYSNFFTLTGHTNLANLGGGLNYWYKDHFGIKLEVLDHFRGAPDSVNYLEFRLGFNFK